MLFLPMLDAIAEWHALREDWMHHYLCIDCDYAEEHRDVEEWFEHQMFELGRKYGLQKTVIRKEHLARLVDSDLDWVAGHIGVTI